MEKILYPLIYYPLTNNSLLGILVGTEYQVIEKDLKQLKLTFSTYLQKQYKKYESYPNVEMIKPKIKMVNIPYRPSIKDEFGSYPLNYNLRIPIPVVYGPTNQGHFECHLPLFERRFYYYDAKQFDSLVQHFAVNILNSESSEKVFRLKILEKPALDFVSLRIKKEVQTDWTGYNYQRPLRTLNRLAEQFPFSKSKRTTISSLPEAAWELEDEVQQVVEKLINTRSNVIVVGNHGLGKSAVIRQAIKKIAGQSKSRQVDFTFWRIMSQRITASSKYLGEWEETCEMMIEELNVNNGILWVIDLARLIQIGGEGPEVSVAAFMMAFLQQGKLQIIGEATPQELESMRRYLPGFVENFQIIELQELPEPKIHSILDKFVNFSAERHKIKLNSDAVTLAYRLLNRYYPYESFPGKGIKFLAQCVSEIQLAEKSEVDKAYVVDLFTKQTGLPPLFLKDEVILDQKELKAYFEAQIIGQNAAIDRMTDIVKIFKAGLNNPYKPITSMIFAGPTGVGKTASAKALAEYFFGKGQKKSPLVRIDMSEFQHPSQIVQFIGSGNQVGKLIKEIRERPFSVLLLDEIEKADPSIFDALLTILDEGVLLDAFGRITNFRNSIIIMTSNLGASQRDSIGFKNTDSESTKYSSVIDKFFRPEFVNRIDHIVLFNALNQTDIKKITKKELDDLKKREGFVKRQLDLEFSQNIVDHLSEIGFDKKYGARPLQRAIEQTIINPLANWILKHPKVKNRKIKIDFDHELIISSANS